MGQSGIQAQNSYPSNFVFKKTLSGFPENSPETEVYIKVKNDSIWRYTKQDGRIIGDYFMIQKNSGILNYYDKSKSINYRKYDLFSKNHKYEIIESKEDKKEILGYTCHKLIMIRLSSKSDLGNTIYEMYVTDEVELPIHSVINLTKLMPSTFPMEIVVSEERLSGVSERYELIKIE